MKLIVLFLFICLPFCSAQHRDTVKIAILYSDTGNVKNNVTYWAFAYAIIEKHNTPDGAIDPGFYQCYDNYGRPVSCFNDYFVNIGYLGSDKKPLPKSFIIWQSIPKYEK